MKVPPVLIAMLCFAAPVSAQERIEMRIGETVIIRTPSAVNDVHVDGTDAASIRPLTDKTFVVVGAKVGRTDVWTVSRDKVVSRHRVYVYGLSDFFSTHVKVYGGGQIKASAVCNRYGCSDTAVAPMRLPTLRDADEDSMPSAPPGWLAVDQRQVNAAPAVSPPK